MSEACIVPGCRDPLTPGMVACKPHWRMVPVRLRNNVWLAEPGTPEREIAMQAAIDAVAAREGRT